MNNSPGTPTGTGSYSESRMYTRVLEIGEPIGTLRMLVSAPGSAEIRWQQVKVVPSVGPYPLIRQVESSIWTALLTWLTDKASPPISNCCRGARASGISSMTALKSDDVSQAELTAWSTMNCARRSGTGIRSGY